MQIKLIGLLFNTKIGTSKPTFNKQLRYVPHKRNLTMKFLQKLKQKNTTEENDRNNEALIVL